MRYLTLRTAVLSSLTVLCLGCDRSPDVSPADPQDIYLIYMRVHSLQLLRDVCIVLRPEDEQMVRAMYSESSADEFASLLGNESDFVPDLQGMDRNEYTGDALGDDSCGDFSRDLAEFDSLYMEQIAPVEAFLKEYGEN